VGVFRSFAVKSLVAKLAYAIACVLALSALVVSGKARQTISEVASIGSSNAITGNSPSVGEMNILVMGLESREDWNDNPLPANELGPLHAGSEQGITTGGVGGHTTNTLILIHIFANGKKAVGISVPRDDYVSFAQDANGTVSPTTYDGIAQGKVDEAYGDAWAGAYNQLYGKGLSHNQEAFQANEAGRKAEIGTVEYLTGVHIDHFVEVNLIGFYDLAVAMNGIEVCLKHPVPYDTFSGFFAHHAGLQHLPPSGALAFVRQRHGLPNGDLDRTHRQQAFIDSVIHQLKTQGVLSDFGKISALLGTAQQYLITDKGWNLLDFADDMAAFSGKNLKFETATTLNPYGHIGTEAVNIIDPAAIKAQVQGLFYPAPTSKSGGGSAGGSKKITDPDPARTTVQVYNGTTVPGLAGQVSQALVKEGYVAGTVGDTQTAQSTTQVLYGSGAQVAAEAIAGQVGGTAQASAQLPAGTVKVLLGPGVNLANVAAPNTTPSSSSTSTPASGSTPNPAGGTVSVPADGIPCVD
jgi:LCP family protein required for cell wall assembly